jgi:hypothetical protein
VGHETKIDRYKAKAIKASLRTPVQAYVLQRALSKADPRRIGEEAVKRAASASDSPAGAAIAQSGADKAVADA